MSITTVASVPGFTWSYSVLKNFESCNRRYYEYNVRKSVVEPESDYIKQGHSVHAAFQARVKSGTPLPLGMGMHEPILAKLAQAPGEVHTEQRLGLSSAFAPTSFNGAGVWFRIVLDYANLRPDGTATVIDYKTGRPSEDMTQLELSAATLFAHDSRIQRVKAALLFVGHDQIEQAEFVRAQTTEIWGGILPRVKKIVEARQRQEYLPSPAGSVSGGAQLRAVLFGGNELAERDMVRALLGDEVDLMGAASRIPAVPPSYVSQNTAQQLLAQSQQLLAQQYTHASALAQQNIAQNMAWNQHNPQHISGGALGHAYDLPVVSMSGLETKVQRKITQALDELPMSICAHIMHIRFYCVDDKHHMRFVVTFKNQHTVSFDDVDSFPAAEHIARIALECP